MPKKQRKCKKGLSDLISNILIVMLVVVIAIIIFSWGYNYFQGWQEQKELEAQKQLACADVYFSVENVCYTKNRIEITLENQASDNIFELVYRLKNNKDLIDSGVATRELGAYSAKKYLFGYVSDIISNTIELFPTIKVNEILVICDNLIRTQDIKICSGYEVKAGEETKCNNKKIDPGEDCDGSNLNDYSCSDFGNYDGGALYCNITDCSVILIGCRESSSGGGGGGGGGGIVTPTTTCIDNDGDGYGIGTDLSQCIGSTTQADCDDDFSDDVLQYILDENVDIDKDGNYAEHIYPGAQERDYNSIDEDCDGSDLKC